MNDGYTAQDDSRRKERGGKVRGEWLMHMEHTFPRGLSGRIFNKGEVRGNI